MASESEKLRTQLLVLRCMRDDHEAWRELIATWERKLLYYIFRLVSHEQDAWDVLQQTWLGAYRNIGRLDDAKEFPRWLYRIARNKAIDHRRLPVAETTDAADDVPASDGDEVDRFDNAESLHLALDQLSIAQRETITLYFLEDFSVNEIAEVLDVPPGTVKSRLHHAKRELLLAGTLDRRKHEKMRSSLQLAAIIVMAAVLMVAANTSDTVGAIRILAGGAILFVLFAMLHLRVQIRESRMKLEERNLELQFQVAELAEQLKRQR